MAYTNSGGGRGASVVINKKTNIISENESVQILKTETEDETVFDLSVELSNETNVASQDGSVEVVESIQPSGTKNFDLSISEYVSEQIVNKQDKLDLVTEEEDGIARALDKKLLDKSFLNSVAIGEGEQYASAEDASAALIEASKGYYYPTTGSTMHWLNTNDNLILSRFYREVGISGTDKTPYRWIGAAYMNGIYVLSAQSDNDTGVGNKLVIATSSNGKSWTVTPSQTAYETFRAVEAGGNYFAVLTGNSSREYYYSSDGTTWTQSSNLADIYWYKLKYLNGYWVAIGRNSLNSAVWQFSVFENDLNNSPINHSVNFIDSFNISDITYFSGKYFCAKSGGVAVVDSTTFDMSLITLTNSYNHIDIVNDMIILSTSNAIAVSSDGINFFEYDLPFVATTQIIYSNENYFIGCASDNAIYYSEDFTTWNSCVMPSGETTETSWNFLINAGSNLLMLSGPQSLFVNGNKSDTSWLINPVNYYIENLGEWVDIPILDSSINGLLSVKNRNYEVLQISDYLALANNVLSTVNFNRYTLYENYPATALNAEAENQTVWINVSLSEIIDNTTLAYSDEACTQSIGTITAHSYNPNNTNEITISVSGMSYVYLFVSTKYPQGLATMQALIDGLANIQGGDVVPSSVENQIFRTVLNEQTQTLETAWSNDWLSGFELFSYMDAQEVGIPYQNDVTAAMLVRFMPDCRSVINSISFIITQGAQKDVKVALYDENRNLLSTSESMTMANTGRFSLSLNQNVKIYPQNSYFIAIMTTGNGYQLLGRNMTIGINNMLPCCFQSQNNLQNNEFPAAFDNTVIQGNKFIPYLKVNGLY